MPTGSLVEPERVGRAQVEVAILCAAVLFIDGFDTQAIGYVAPALARTLHVSRAALGPVFSAGLFGLMIGALSLGPLADRVGRRRVILASTVAFGVCSLATALAQGTGALLALRFLTGLGLGGAMPNAIALIAEFSPPRRRGTMVMVTFCGFSVGAALGGLLAAAVIPFYGWQGVFVVGGALPLALGPFVAWRLPESPRFLGLRRERATSVQPVGELFREGRGVSTVLFWVVFFASLLDLYLLSNWLPTLLTDRGASVSHAAALASLLQGGGVVGILLLGAVVDRFSLATLPPIYLGAAIAIAAIGRAAHPGWRVAVGIAAAGFCIVGGQTAANALAATFYPTRMRSTGVGWALGVGRVGSIVGPLVGGLMLTRHVGSRALFLAAAVPAMVACVASLGLKVSAVSRGSSR